MGKMFKNRIKLYNKYNNTNLDVNDLVCSICLDWLPKGNFLDPFGKRVCYTCPLQHPSTLSTTVERPEDEKFPCRYHPNGCTEFASYVHINAHEYTCSKSDAIYCFCMKELLKNEITSHLKKKHSMTTTQIQKPMVKLNIKLEKQPGSNILTFPFHLTIGLTALIIIVSYDAQSSKFDVIVSNITDMPRNMTYKAVFIYKNNEYSKYDQVFEHFAAKSSTNLIFIPNVQGSLTLKVFFEGYEKIQPIVEYFEDIIKDYECPICMEIIKHVCYQCANGHQICVMCNNMVDACPTCSTKFKQEAVPARRSSPDFLRPCKNASNGCFVHGKCNEIEDHEHICPMRVITCEICKINVDPSTYMGHLTKKHKLKKVNEMPVKVQPGLIGYKEQVFKFSVENKTIEKGSKIILYEWSLYLVYNCDKICEKVFEMQIAHGDTTTTTKGTFSKSFYKRTFCVNKAETPIFTLTLPF